MASWFAPSPAVTPPVRVQERAHERVQVRWLLPAVQAVQVPAAVARPVRPVVAAARPAPVAVAMPTPVPAAVPVSQDVPEAAAPPEPVAVAPVVFAPPAFGGGQRRAWGRPPALPVDLAALVLAQQQRAQAAVLAQARVAVQDGEARRLAAACDLTVDPTADVPADPCRP